MIQMRVGTIWSLTLTSRRHVTALLNRVLEPQLPVTICCMYPSPLSVSNSVYQGTSTRLPKNTHKTYNTSKILRDRLPRSFRLTRQDTDSCSCRPARRSPKVCEWRCASPSSPPEKPWTNNWVVFMTVGNQRKYISVNHKSKPLYIIHHIQICEIQITIGVFLPAELLYHRPLVK